MYLQALLWWSEIPVCARIWPNLAYIPDEIVKITWNTCHIEVIWPIELIAGVFDRGGILRIV